MTVYNFRLRLVSPAFIAGSDKNRPEMRAASVRGQLRYWLRALAGAYQATPGDVWQRESRVFGSTEGGSAVAVRVYRDTPAKSGDYAMLPHRHNEGRRGLSIQKALNAGQLFDLQLVTRPGVDLPVDAFNALRLWSLLGGIGRRSRRMFGAVQITTEDVPGWYPTPQSPAELFTLISDTLRDVIGSPSPAGIPDFPTLHPSHAWVIVGTEPYDTQEDLVKSLFTDLLRTDEFRAHETTFGQAMGGRRASPLIAQVRRIRIDGEDRFYPVLTALRSRPDKRIRWDHLKRFMEAAEKHYSAQRVWGGW